ncbi:b(0,+)-type amino acid transporter 1-like [Mytilus californianus]|uniref:b(0,+)-type amino acid transporter 1-like n=1 Tax=Mytilus californianus TaxID=6549 RepID=UPI002247BEDA|nr:b(0,+)-type amino acid transporter 1-like [Mytilus californianus]
MMIPADLSKMLNLVGFIGWIFDGLIMVVHIVLHFRMKNVERPFKVPIIVPIIVIIFVLYILIAPFLEPVKTEFWYALSFLLAGVVLYIPFVFFKLRLPGIG